MHVLRCLCMMRVMLAMMDDVVLVHVLTGVRMRDGRVRRRRQRQ